MRLKKSGFTLIELLVVIAIIGLLSVVAVVALNQARIKAANSQKNATVVQYAKAFELALDADENKSYPYVTLNNTGFICLGIYSDSKCWNQSTPGGNINQDANTPKNELEPFMATSEQVGENFLSCGMEGFIYRCLVYEGTNCIKAEINWAVQDRSDDACGPGKKRTINELTGDPSVNPNIAPDCSRCSIVLLGK